jgi:hypothetical protein
MLNSFLFVSSRLTGRIRYNRIHSPKFIRLYSNHNKNNNSHSLTFKDFKNFEHELSKIKLSNCTFSEKLKFLLKYSHVLNISDLNIDLNSYDKLFIHLITIENINFNENYIHGIGKLFKLLPIVSNIGIDLIKNCGILNSKFDIMDNNNKSSSYVFLNQYNDNLRLLTIDILIQNKYYREAFNYCQLLESLNKDSFDKSQLIKFYLKLSKFKNFNNNNNNLKSIDIIDNSIIPIYLRELIKNGNYSIEKKLEYYLLIIFKLFNLQDLNPNLFPKFNSNQLHSLNTIFLSLLHNQKGVGYNVYLSYYIKLYPKSIPILEQLNLLSTNSNQKKPIFLNDLPNVNIRPELIQSSIYPYMEDLSLLYSKFLHDTFPNKFQLKTLFNNYLNLVKNYQNLENINSSSYEIIKNPYPFSKFNHDSSILSSFLDYSFNREKGFFKPILSSNLILKFYKNLKISQLDYYKSKFFKSHIKQLQYIIDFLSNVRNSNCDLPLAIEILKNLDNSNIYLHSKSYILIINSLIKLNQFEEAKKFYMFFIYYHPIISKKIQLNQIIPLCDRFKWPLPDSIISNNLNNDNNNNNNDLLEFNDMYLSGNLSPEEIIKQLDSITESIINEK